MKYEFEKNQLIAELWTKAFIVQGLHTKNFDIICSLLSDYLNRHEIKEPEPLKLEVGEFYKNRKGDKCFVYSNRVTANKNLDFYYIVVGKCELNAVKIDGMCSFGFRNQKNDELDLISEWTAEDEKEWRKKNESL